MYKKIAFLIFGLALISAPLYTSAQTFSSLPDRCPYGYTLQDDSCVIATSCPNLTTRLGIWDNDRRTGGQVSELQAFLSRYFNLSVGTLSGGYFGSLTRSYVKQFQTQHNISATGSVGSLTRAKIAEVCGGGTTSGSLMLSWKGTQLKLTSNVSLDLAQRICGYTSIQGVQCTWNGQSIRGGVQDGSPVITINSPASNEYVLRGNKSSFSFEDPSATVESEYLVFYVLYSNNSTIGAVYEIPFTVFGRNGTSVNGDVDISRLPNGNYYPFIVNVTSGIGGSVGAYVFLYGDAPFSVTANNAIHAYGTFTVTPTLTAGGTAVINDPRCGPNKRRCLGNDNTNGQNTARLICTSVGYTLESFVASFYAGAYGRANGAVTMMVNGDSSCTSGCHALTQVTCNVVSSSATTQPAIQITSPVAGSVHTIGRNITVAWDVSGAPANAQVIRTLTQVTSDGSGNIGGGTWQSSLLPVGVSSGSNVIVTGGVGNLDRAGTYRIDAAILECDPSGCNFSYGFPSASYAKANPVTITIAPSSTTTPVTSASASYSNFASALAALEAALKSLIAQLSR